MQAIGNSLGNYIDKAEPKGPLFSYARICIEVDPEKGLPEAIILYMDGWEHMQKVDYEQLPFKCKKCHEYGHFVKNFPKVVQEKLEKKIKRKDGNKQKGEEKLLHYQVRCSQRYTRKSLKKEKKPRLVTNFRHCSWKTEKSPPWK